MKKKRNVIKRNSGFIAGCLLAAGASYFTADTVMTKGLPAMLMKPAVEETGPETDAQETTETLAPEKSEVRVFETDPFTVTASGNVVKGVEAELPQPKETESGTETVQTDENGEPVEGTDDGSDSYDGSGETYYDDGSYSSGDGSYDDGSSSGDVYYDDGGSYSDVYYDDGSYSDGHYDDGSYDGGYDGPAIEIQDPGNGSYTYDDGSYSGGSGDGSGSSSDDGSAWTPDDVILWGISSRYIDESELYNYSAEQLRLIRNEIFALHGRIFNSQDLADYFSQKSWYVPTYPPEEFDENMFYYLNDYEEANLNVILNYEAALAGN